MGRNEHEKWLEKLKDSLDAYPPELPAQFWDNLQYDLNIVKTGKGVRVRIKHLLMYGCAAAAILLLLLLLPWNGTVVKVQPETSIAMGDNDMQYVEDVESIQDVEGVQDVKGTTVVRQENEGPAMEQQVQDVPKTRDNLYPLLGKINRYNALETVKILSPQHTYDVPEPAKLVQQSAGKSHVEQETIEYESVAKGNNSKIWLALNVGNAAGGEKRGGNIVQASSAATTNPAKVDGLLNLGVNSNQMVSFVGDKVLASFSNNPVYRQYDYSHKQPLRFGISFAMNIAGRLDVESGVMYQYLKSEMHVGNAGLKQELHYVGVPVKLNWTFVDKGKFSLYAGAGYMLEKCVYGQINNMELELKKWQNSLMATAGVQLHLGGRSYLYFEPGASYYLGMDNEVISMQKGFMVKTIYSERPFTVTFNGGVRFLF